MMHSQSLALTIGGTVLKESDDLDIFGVTVTSKMNFEKHLCSVSRASLGILKYMQMGILQFSSTVCGARLPIHTLNHWTV